MSIQIAERVTQGSRFGYVGARYVGRLASGLHTGIRSQVVHVVIILATNSEIVIIYSCNHRYLFSAYAVGQTLSRF